MQAPNNLEKLATRILDDAYWFQDRICAGCTNLFHSRADIVDEQLALSDPQCLNPDCAGHDPVAAYLGALQVLASHRLIHTEEGR